VAEQFLPSLERMEPRPPVIFFGHDLHCLRARREQELLGDAATIGQAEDWRQREYAVFHRVDHIWYPSQVEVDEILASEPGLSVTAIPLYVVEPRPLPAYDPATRQGMLFVGGFNHPPNADGIRWFIDEVLPLVRARCPHLVLQLVGSSMPEEIRALRTEGVEILGFLSDEKLDALYQNVKLAIVPLRYGAGVKGKVIEALQQGLPLVTTSVGAEGLPEPASVMQLADDAAAFAERIIAIEGADPAALALLDGYPAYLQENFSRQRAEDIVRRHFGDPVRER
jgi:glycosyltransferase involved in cell wall biosynthesis